MNDQTQLKTPPLSKVIAAIIFLTPTVTALAGSLKAPPQPPPPAPKEHSIFDAGSMELQSGTGAYWSFIPDNSDRPTLNYILSNFRFGYMLSDVTGNGCLRGNAEFLLEGFYNSVFEGSGDWFVGGNLLLRYNFVQPNTPLIPYIQLGAGGLWNNVYKDQSQTLIGESFEFSLLASVGLRYQFDPKWAFALEGGYRHISNANLAPRNTGLDSLGATLGLIYSF